MVSESTIIVLRVPMPIKVCQATMDKVRYFSAGSLLVCNSMVSAAPNVTDNAIAWPGAGWNQMQDAADYSRV